MKRPGGLPERRGPQREANDLPFGPDMKIRYVQTRVGAPFPQLLTELSESITTETGEPLTVETR